MTGPGAPGGERRAADAGGEVGRLAIPPGARLAWPEVLALLAPLALAAVGYGPSLHGEFQLDDHPGIVENPAVKAPGAWLAGAGFPEVLLTGRPLTTLSFAANYALGRLDPLGYHLVNLALHLAVALLAGLLALRVASLAGAERPRRLALGVAGLFAVHPLQSQAVAYVSQRAELLASALYAGALLCLLARGPGARPRPWGRWGAALVLFALGFGAKPMVVTLPAAFLLVQLAAAPPAPGARPAWRAALPVAAAFGAVAALLSVALLAALRGRPDAGFSVAGTSPWGYLLTQLQACAVYLRLLVWPAGQSVDWAFPSSPGLGDPATLGAAALLAALAAASAWLLRRGRHDAGPDGAAARLAGLGVAWFFLVLAPTSSFVPLADNLVEHRTYLASWGILLAAVVGADWAAARLLTRQAARRAALAAWGVALLALAAALHQRTAVWETREALWRDALARNPAAARARVALADAFSASGRIEEAIAEYQAALRATAGHPRQEGQVLAALGVAQLDAGRPEEARRTLERALALQPENDQLLVNLAAMAGGAGDAAGAEALARRALSANPAQPGAWVIVGNLALERGDGPGALDGYDRAIALDPDRGEAHYGRALVLEAMERGPESCRALRDALQASLRPGYRAAVTAELQARCR